MRMALAKATVGSLWGEDPVPLMACVCVALSLCRLLLSRSSESVTDENDNGRLKHKNITMPLPSIDPVHRTVSTEPLTVEEEQVKARHVLLSVCLSNQNICSDHTHTRMILFYSLHTIE